MPAHSHTTLFYGFLFTGTSLLVAAEALNQINDRRIRLALQRKGLDVRLRRLVLEELVPSTIESVEEILVKSMRCRGCLRVEQARRSAVTLALCLLRHSLPAELCEMVMNHVLDGDIGEPWEDFEARSIRGFAKLRRDAEEFPGGAGDDRRLRWTDVFISYQSSPPKQCYICAADGLCRIFRNQYDRDQQDDVDDFLAQFGLHLVTRDLNGPPRRKDRIEQCLYHTYDVLAAVQVQSFQTMTIFTTTSPPCDEDYGEEVEWDGGEGSDGDNDEESLAIDGQDCAVLQATHASLSAHLPVVPPTTINALSLFGVRSTELDVPEKLIHHHVAVGTVGRAYAGSNIQEPAWTLWAKIGEN